MNYQVINAAGSALSGLVSLEQAYEIKEQLEISSDDYIFIRDVRE